MKTHSVRSFKSSFASMPFTKEGMSSQSEQGFTRLVDFGDVPTKVEARFHASPKLTTGFTLIELLVVVAIIGILASVVLASLNTARAKGSDSAVKASMANMRAQADLWYSNNSNRYNDDGSTALTVCVDGIFDDFTFIVAINQITTESVAPACNTNATGQKWAMSVSALKGGGTWCIDSSGWIKPGVAALGVCS